MATFIVPSDEPGFVWPTLGLGVCQFIEDYLVHGPGDLRGDRIHLDDETMALICRAYEVFPRGHEFEGRRRFKRVAWSLRKGTAKTEKAAWIVIVEAHPEGPVRFDGWDAAGLPVGRPIRDPYIPMVADTVEQTEDLAYGAVYAILTDNNCPIAADFDPNLERITRRDGTGKIKAMAGAPSARDGARTTFQHFDETHGLKRPAQIKAHERMRQNTNKRPLADAWTFETTTMYGPGEDSIAEGTHKYALQVASGEIKDSTLFFFHRQASIEHNIETEEGRKAAVIEASGPYIVFTDVRAVANEYLDPQTDQAMWRRLWLNQPWQTFGSLVDPLRWSELVGRKNRPPDIGDSIVVGFDGSERRDSTALVGTLLSDPMHQFVIAVWERPRNSSKEWQVPRRQVREVMTELRENFTVRRVVCDPWGWQNDIDTWADEFGEDWEGNPIVITFDTRQTKAFVSATDRWLTAIKTGALTWDGSEVFGRHVGNMASEATTWGLKPVKFEGEGDRKIDVGVAAILSWQEAEVLADELVEEAPTVW
jgi:phage terminase large subunit-like protein